MCRMMMKLWRQEKENGLEMDTEGIEVEEGKENIPADNLESAVDIMVRSNVDPYQRDANPDPVSALRNYQKFKKRNSIKKS